MKDVNYDSWLSSPYCDEPYVSIEEIRKEYLNIKEDYENQLIETEKLKKEMEELEQQMEDLL